LPYLNYRLLNDGDERCRLAAASALARITGLTGAGVASLLGEIEGSLPSKGTPKDSGTAVDIRESTIASTEDLGPLAQLATPILVRISESETTDAILRISAAHALIRGGIGPQAGIAAFRKILLLKDQIATKMALDSVNDLGTLAVALVPEITAVMDSEDAEPEVRVFAARTLVRVSGSAKPGVAFIIENLVHSENTILTLECIRALGSLGALGSDAVPVLNKLGESDEDTERFAAVNEALREIDSGIITAEMH
jgi:HEAT repeat protein